MPKAETLVVRSDRKLFLKVGETYQRMTGFTAGTKNMNPKEYSRQYIDEAFERTSVTGMSVSIDFTFDMMNGNAVHEQLADIIDSEKLGTDAVVSIVEVCFDKPDDEGGFHAVQRDFSVIGSTSGDGTDAFTYSGSFRVEGDRTEGVATIATPDGGNKDNVEAVTFVSENM
jgi:hypothetical protein